MGAVLFRLSLLLDLLGARTNKLLSLKSTLKDRGEVDAIDDSF